MDLSATLNDRTKFEGEKAVAGRKEAKTTRQKGQKLGFHPTSAPFAFQNCRIRTNEVIGAGDAMYFEG